MGVLDRRKSLIVDTAGHFFGVAIKNDVSNTERPVLEKFLDEASCRTLCAQPGDNGLRLTNELPAGKNTLVFFKLSASTVSEENFHDLVQIASTGGGGGNAFLEAIRQVWAPSLHKD